VQHNEHFQIDFTGIGVAKSGTSWLSSCLSEHPGICMAPMKETNFFTIEHPMAKAFPRHKRFKGSSHYTLGMEWYEARFVHRQPGQVVGEYSNSYFGDPESPRLLHEHNPKLKLIVCYRNPADAAYSLYYQTSQHRLIREPFEDFMKRPELLAYFRYYENTCRFFQRFPREQMLLLLYDDARKDPEGVFAKVCRFLEVDDTVRPPSLHRKVNVRKVVRYKWLRDARCLLSAFLGSNALARGLRTGLARVGLARAVDRLYHRLGTKEGVYEPINPRTREILHSMFREENLRLAELLSRDLSEWNQTA